MAYAYTDSVGTKDASTTWTRKQRRHHPVPRLCYAHIHSFTLGSCNKYFLSNILCSLRPKNTQEQKFHHVTVLL